MENHHNAATPCHTTISTPALPVLPPVPPAQSIQPAMPQFNWSHFKPEFTG